jgi:hypothetical protein
VQPDPMRRAVYLQDELKRHAEGNYTPRPIGIRSGGTQSARAAALDNTSRE